MEIRQDSGDAAVDNPEIVRVLEKSTGEVHWPLHADRAARRHRELKRPIELGTSTY
jgi:hypothetical protein